MRWQPTLAQRIIAAFVLTTAAIAGLFAMSIVSAVEDVELRLVSEAMNRDLDFVLAERKGERVVHMAHDLRFYEVRDGEENALPDWLQALEPGLHERETAGDAFHVLVREQDGVRFLLVLDQDEFERREQMLRTIVYGGFALCVVVATALGAALARTVIAPVVRLAQQVQHRNLPPGSPPLAPEYTSDEVGKLAAAFDQALGKLSQALERERLFTSDVSHELRTPLTVIATSCELLLAQAACEPRQRALAERAARACGEMQELVETFLRLARAPEGERPEAGPGVPLAVIADEQARRWQPEAEAKGLAFRIEMESPDAGLYSRPLLRAVMSNLLRNAIHYTDGGFVRLVLRKGGFSVLDSGVGIPAADRNRMFHPFTRGDKSRGDGVGIGLSLVQRICAHLGWRVQLHEAEGGGCEFRIDISPP